MTSTHLTASPTHILVYGRDDEKLTLVDATTGHNLRSLVMQKECGKVHDMCYSPRLNAFLVLTLRELFELNLDTFKLVKVLNANNDYSFSSVDVSNLYAFITHQPKKYITRWSMEPKWEQTDLWETKSLLLQPDDIGIGRLRVDSRCDRLVASVLQKNFQWRIDVFNCKCNIVLRGTTFGDGVKSSIECQLLVLPNSQCLFIDRSTSRVWLVQRDRTVQRVHMKPTRTACCIGDQVALSIFATSKLLYLRQL